MDSGSILLGTLLLAALAVAVAWPWLRPLRWHRAQGVSIPSAALDASLSGVEVADLQQRYQALVAAIRDLDFDYRAGVVTEEDYQPLRNELALQAATLLQELDRHPDQETDAEAQIEAMVSALRAQHRQRPAISPDGAGIVGCPECGHLTQPGDRFCARCGTKLQLAYPS